MLAGKRIVLGVTGGIAAYKAVEVCRRLVDAGAHVIPVMTKGAEHFIGRTTLSALASEPGTGFTTGSDCTWLSTWFALWRLRSIGSCSLEMPRTPTCRETRCNDYSYYDRLIPCRTRIYKANF